MRSRIFILLLALSGSAAAQQPDPAPRFEIVSIRPNKSARAENRLDLQPSGRITWTAATLRGLIGTAFQRWAFDQREVIGGPEWLDRERFDITALANGPLRVDRAGFPEEPFAMIRTMLAERFALRVHEEVRDRPIYALVVARPGQLGARLAQSTVDCVTEMAEQAKGKKPTRLPDGRFACVLGGPPGRLVGAGLRMPQLATALVRFVGRPVVDRTGLTGAYDWDVEFRPELAQPIGNEPPPAPEAFADRPSIFTALQEQLGLRLESTRGPVDVLVVDHAELPAPD